MEGEARPSVIPRRDRGEEAGDGGAARPPEPSYR